MGKVDRGSSSAELLNAVCADDAPASRGLRLAAPPQLVQRRLLTPSHPIPPRRIATNCTSGCKWGYGVQPGLQSSCSLSSPFSPLPPLPPVLHERAHSSVSSRAAGPLKEATFPMEPGCQAESTWQAKERRRRRWGRGLHFTRARMRMHAPAASSYRPCTVLCDYDS